MLFSRLDGRTGFSVGLMTALLVSASATAQSTWDGGGGDNNWGTPANWADNAVPTFPRPLVFAGTTRPAPNNNLGNVSVDGIAFSGGAAAFTIGGDAFTLGDNATADYRRGGISQQDDSLQTIANNLTLARGQRDITTVDGAGGLSLNGTITRGNGSAARFVPLGGPIKTTLINTNGLIGGWATVQNKTPALMSETFLFAKVDASGNVVPYLDYNDNTNIDGFGGETTLPAGVNGMSNLRWFGGADLTFPAGTTDMNTFLFEENGLRTANIGMGNTLRFTSGGGIFRSNPMGTQGIESLRFADGTVTAGSTNAPAELNIWTSTTLGDPNTPPSGEEHNFTIHFSTAAITDNAAGGAVRVVKNGPGAVRVSSTGNTFSGGLYLNRGVWRAQTNVATAFGAGDVHVASGAQAYVNADGTVPNNFFLNGTGINEGTFHVGAIRVAADGAVMNGDIHLTADTRIGNRGAQATAAQLGMPADQGVLWNGKITGSGNLELSIGNDQGVAALDGDMPTMIFANSTNDWTGNTTLGNGRTRIGGTGEVIPHGPGKGNLTLRGEGSAAMRPTILTLDSKTETVNGLSSVGTLSEVFITNQTAGLGTLRVGANDATSTFGGTIQDDTAVGGMVAVTKIGSGALTLTGTNNYTGDTRVDGGTLSISNTFLANGADVFVASGALLNLNFVGSDTIDSLFLGGIPRATGTWGAAGSGATNISPFFTGTGTLTVSTLGMAQLLVGDFNGNGTVDAADYVLWLNGGPLMNDPTPGVQPGDYDTWRANFGRTSGAGAVSASVPEPATWMLLVAAGLMVLWTRRRKLATF